MDNGYGQVAHSAHVPPFSTELLISNYKYDNAVVVGSQLWSINQKDHILVVHFHQLGTLMQFSNVGLPTSSLPVVAQCTHACHFCWKPQLTSP